MINVYLLNQLNYLSQTKDANNERVTKIYGALTLERLDTPRIRAGNYMIETRTEINDGDRPET